MKRLLIWSVVGLVVGIAGGTAIGVHLIEWYFESPGAPVTCTPQIHGALNDLLEGQGIGAVAGLALFLIFGILWGRRHRTPSGPGNIPQRLG